jgi:hypothetical protein
MHRNPVKRGLVEQPEQWRWGSYRAYFYGEEGPVRVNFQEWPVEIKIGSIPVQTFAGDWSTPRPPLPKLRVQSHDMLYSLSRDILYSFGTSSDGVSQRLTAVECWLLKSSSRIKVWQ